MGLCNLHLWYISVHRSLVSFGGLADLSFHGVVAAFLSADTGKDKRVLALCSNVRRLRGCWREKIQRSHNVI